MNPDRRCTANSSRSGRRCKKPAVIGATVCNTHGGMAPQVRKAAEVRAAKMAAHTAAERMVARAGVDADPIEHLLDSLYRAAALVEVWGQMVADLDNAAEVDLRDRPGGLRGETWYEQVDVPDRDGGTKTIRVPRTDRLLGFTRDGSVTTHPFVVEYQSWLDRRAKYAKLCVDAGIADRQVRLAEQQGELVAQVIRSVLTDLGHDLASADVLKVVGRHLRAVS